MGCECKMHGIDTKTRIKYYLENLKTIHISLGSIILKWRSNKMYMKILTVFTWFRTGILVWGPVNMICKKTFPPKLNRVYFIVYFVLIIISGEAYIL